MEDWGREGGLILIHLAVNREYDRPLDGYINLQIAIIMMRTLPCAPYWISAVSFIS